ncbi:MAG: DUF3597 domain-containing protein [Asticcacaulis sp.]
MGIFTAIKDFIFGHHDAPAAAPAAAAPAPQAAAPAATAPAPAKPMSEADVEALLAQKAAAYGQPLNWKTSIVDLMKLCGLDPTLAHREELAKELGYTGALDGSAEMNIWLHAEVMKKLAEDGGSAPAGL